MLYLSVRIKSGLACAAHAAAVHLLLSVATKVGKNAFAAESRRLAKTKSCYQRKVGLLLNALRRQLGSFIYHRQRVNALLLTIFFLLPSVWLCLRSQIHVGSLEGFNLSPANSKRFAIFHILSFADVGGCRGVGFVEFFGFVSKTFCYMNKTYSSLTRQK